MLLLPWLCVRTRLSGKHGTSFLVWLMKNHSDTVRNRSFYHCHGSYLKLWHSNHDMTSFLVLIFFCFVLIKYLKLLILAPIILKSRWILIKMTLKTIKIPLEKYGSLHSTGNRKLMIKKRKKVIYTAKWHRKVRDLHCNFLIFFIRSCET